MRQLIFIVCFYASLYSTVTLADPLQFSIELNQTIVDVDYLDGSPIEMTTESAAIYWREQFYENFYAGARIGSTESSQRGRNMAVTFRGEFWGLDFDWQLWGIERHAVVLSGDYQRHSQRNSSETQPIKQRWQQWRSDLAWQTTLLQPVTVSVGVYVFGLSGEERQMGAISDFENHDNTGGFLRLLFDLQSRGYMALSAHAGATQSVQLHFGQRY